MSKEVERKDVNECDTRNIYEMIYEQNKRDLNTLVDNMKKEMEDEKSC